MGFLPLAGLAGTRQATTIGSSGASTASSASANTKGSYTVLTAATPFDADGFYLNILGGTASRDFLIDIAVGAGGSEVVILSNFPLSSGSVANVEAQEVYIPLPIPAGSQVSARCQASTGSSSCFVGITLVQGNFFSALKLARATTYGANTADSGGTGVDPGAVSNTVGAYSVLSAAITNRIKHAIICIGAQNNFVRTGSNHTTEIGIGAAAAEQVVIPGMYHAQDTTRDSFSPPLFERAMSVKAGTRLAVRGKASTTDGTDRQYDVILIGFD